MFFQHLYAKKVKLNDLTTMQRHLTHCTRRKKPLDVDTALPSMNYTIEELAPKRLNSRVKERITQLHLKRRPRSDAVGIEDIVIGTSPEFMQNAKMELREQYFLDALHFFQARYGEENVMYCQCHLDESNPHIHVGIMPVTADGRLSAKSLFTPKSLEILQTAFHREVSAKYGLMRGEYHVRQFLELCNFKIEQLRLKLEVLAENLELTALNQKELHRITTAAESESFLDDDNVEYVKLPIADYQKLLQMAHESIKIRAMIHKLQAEFEECKKEVLKLRILIEQLQQDYSSQKKKIG